MRDTIDMAREAVIGHPDCDPDDIPALEGDDLAVFQRFEALVREDEREETNRRANASWALMCEKMVAAEREACAKVCEETYTGEEASHDWPTPEMCAAAIRARNER